MKTATPTVVRNTASQAEDAPAAATPEPGHSPEPWVFDDEYGYVNDANGEPIADFYSRQVGRLGSKANRRRAIAAVNACAGIPIEALELGDYARAAAEQCAVAIEEQIAGYVNGERVIPFGIPADQESALARQVIQECAVIIRNLFPVRK